MIEAFVLGRLLRIRLLTLRATVVISPGDVARADVTAPATASPAMRALRARPPARSDGANPVRPAASGRRGLAEAVRTIDEGAAILAEARRTAARRGG